MQSYCADYDDQSCRLRGRNILVMDDEPLIALDVCDMLRMEGAEARYARQLAQGLQIIECSRLDAAICQYHVGGDRLLDKLFERHIPVVLYTAHNLRSTNFDGPVRMVHKPANGSQLVEAVSNAIGMAHPQY